MSGLYVGIMSGTSLDGVDAVLASFDDSGRPTLVASASSGFDAPLRAGLLALQATGTDELHRAALAANRLADLQATLVERLCRDAGIAAADVVAIGSHGQTVRHRPDLGYTIQLNAPARLAEATGIAVVADFRSRDVAAGGQGAPLVPAFHAARFRVPGAHRIVLNLGGMSNVTDLPADVDAPVRGWDCGPGNVLLDTWIARHRGVAFDRDGAWAAGGNVDDALLDGLRADPWFALAPPKSTGRDRFDAAWLDTRLADRPDVAPRDVQATLAALTATVIADAIAGHAGPPADVVVCGGGARNTDLLARLSGALAGAGMPTVVVPSHALGDGAIAPEHVEALAFAWLAMRRVTERPGNLPAVTGAIGSRVLGALHSR